MDNLENFTIPPELFYSRNNSESKRNKISSIVPKVIKKKFKVVRNFVSGNRNGQRKKSVVSPNRPQLGSINKNYLKMLKAKRNARQQKKIAEKPKSLIKNIPTKISLNESRDESTVTMVSTLDMTVQNPKEPKALKDVSNSHRPIMIPRPVKPSLIQIEKFEDDEDESRKRPWEQEYKPRKKSGSFKFFKSKNERSSAEESDHSSDDDLFRGSDMPLEKMNEVGLPLNPDNDFADDADHEFAIPENNIESLLNELENGDNLSQVINESAIQSKDVQNSTTIQNVIDILEGKEAESDKSPATAGTSKNDKDLNENILEIPGKLENDQQTSEKVEEPEKTEETVEVSEESSQKMEKDLKIPEESSENQEIPPLEEDPVENAAIKEESSGIMEGSEDVQEEIVENAGEASNIQENPELTPEMPEKFSELPEKSQEPPKESPNAHPEEPLLKLRGSVSQENLTEKTPEKGVFGRLKEKITNKFFGFGHNQLQIDAGQKKFGVVECKDCGLNYNTNVPEDEQIHKKYHDSLMKIPKFRGWANEESYTITGCNLDDTRIIHLPPNHKNLSSMYVQDLLASMRSTLGVQFENPEKYHIYIAVVDSKMVGLCAVQENVQAFPIDSPTKEREAVRLGIQRLFVRSEFRRKKLAGVLLKTITMKHVPGQLLDLVKDIAFSSPTEDGVKFIKGVLMSDSFYVY